MLKTTGGAPPVCSAQSIGMEDIVIALYSLVFPVRCPLILQESLNHLALLPYSSPTRQIYG